MKTLSRFSLALLLAAACGLGGCSHFSSTARQQRAYEKYVRKSSITRSRQSVKLRPGKVQLPPMPAASEPVITAASGPQSITGGSE